MNDAPACAFREPANGLSRFASRLAGWSDPEWLLFVGILLFPALLWLLLGNLQAPCFSPAWRSTWVS